MQRDSREEPFKQRPYRELQVMLSYDWVKNMRYKLFIIMQIGIIYLFTLKIVTASTCDGTSWPCSGISNSLCSNQRGCGLSFTSCTGSGSCSYANGYQAACDAASPGCT